MNLEQPAQAGASFDFYSRPLCDPEHFPMLVWLRGDEIYCEEFSLGADAVMEILGIKRSRLTQISGRELRVARRRDGRYIRPMYRPADVEDYKLNARAPMTHLKSSEVFNHTFDGVWEQFDNKLTQEVEFLKELQQELFIKSIESMKKIIDEKLQQSYSVFSEIIERKFLVLEELNKIEIANLGLEISEKFVDLQPKDIILKQNFCRKPATKKLSRNTTLTSKKSIPLKSPRRITKKDFYE